MKFELRLLANAVALALIGAALPVVQASAEAPKAPYGVLDAGDEDFVPLPVGSPSAQAKAYSPYAGRQYPTQVYWGDTHNHTSNSGDAFAAGARLTPEDAYRFARGEEVVSSTGVPAKLSRPLDFLVISDHAEGLGLMYQVYEGNPAFSSDPTLMRWGAAMKAGGKGAGDTMNELISAAMSPRLPVARNE